MKKRMMIFLFFLLLLTSCGKYLNQPENTNLSFWITQKDADFSACSKIYGCFGCEQYLDSKYELVNGELPEIYVLYTVTSYPDYSSKNQAITSIFINDPNIEVYGLTLSSHPDLIFHTMKNYGFKQIKDQNEALSYQKNNVTFHFSSNYIRINAHVTNRFSIQF